MMMEENIRAKIAELESQLISKEKDISGYLERIEQLEDNIMILESVIPKIDTKESDEKWKDAINTKLALDLEKRNKQIRNLKDRMGYLRRDMIQLKLELNKYTKKKPEGSIIRIEEKKEPLEILVKELQDKIHKQQLIINKLQEDNKQGVSEQSKANPVKEIEDKIEQLKEEVKIKNLKIDELKNIISDLNAGKDTIVPKPDNTVKFDFVSDLTKELQEKLNKAKLEIKSLQNELETCKQSKKSTENKSI